MTLYCPKCKKLSELDIRVMDETYTVKGEKITIKSEVSICESCGGKVFNPTLDDKNLLSAYSAYRKRHNLLVASEIVNIRNKYSLSQRSLARLLEWGEITITRYESGAIQDPSHNEVLIFVSNPKNMKEIFEKNGNLLPKATREKLAKRINELISEDVKPQFRAVLEDYISFNKSIDEYSGFASFDLEKIINMILRIAGEKGGIFTTKLNKLLWYADFLSFKTCTRSISGSRYIHLPLGPIPDNYKWIIAVALDEGLLKEEEVSFPSRALGIRYVATASCDESLFNSMELKIIDFVTNYFNDFDCVAIKDASHQEKAYRDTRDNERISYKYASDLSLTLDV